MSKIQYIDHSFNKSSREVLTLANQIISEYAAGGWTLTVRQIYYQFVRRNAIKNDEKNYGRMIQIINDGRLAGEIDWDAIEDRTRNYYGYGGWRSPADMVKHYSSTYSIDLWQEQPKICEVWVEKESLAPIAERAAGEFRVGVLANKGYLSQSEMHAAAMRFLDRLHLGQETVVIHLGDHDPSGIDMSRDIIARIQRFMTHHVGKTCEIKRIALNMDQVEQYQPPPNPTKVTDSRCDGYVSKYGESCWELDALEPAQLTTLISDTIREHIDWDKWNARQDRENRERQVLTGLGQHWEKVAKLIESGKFDPKPRKPRKPRASKPKRSQP